MLPPIIMLAPSLFNWYMPRNVSAELELLSQLTVVTFPAMPVIDVSSESDDDSLTA